MLLLASGVPNLQVHFAAVDVNRPGLKVGADGGLGLASTSRSELVDECGLADVDVAEKDHLCKELLLMGNHFCNNLLIKNQQGYDRIYLRCICQQNRCPLSLLSPIIIR